MPDVAIDSFKDYAKGLTGPAAGAFEITPDNGSELEKVTRGLTVNGAAGLINVVMEDGSGPVKLYCSLGQVLPVRVRKVLEDETTAEGIVGLV